MCRLLETNSGGALYGDVPSWDKALAFMRNFLGLPVVRAAVMEDGSPFVFFENDRGYEVGFWIRSMNHLQMFARPRQVHSSLRAEIALWVASAGEEKPAHETSSAAGSGNTENWWAILYEDADRKPELFTDEASAKSAYAERVLNWSCHLFQRVKGSV